jgi:hypothetical protein
MSGFRLPASPALAPPTSCVARGHPSRRTVAPQDAMAAQPLGSFNLSVPLLLSADGKHYLVNVSLGAPPGQTQLLIADTGSGDAIIFGRRHCDFWAAHFDHQVRPLPPPPLPPAPRAGPVRRPRAAAPPRAPDCLARAARRARVLRPRPVRERQVQRRGARQARARRLLLRRRGPPRRLLRPGRSPAASPPPPPPPRRALAPRRAAPRQRTPRFLRA